MDEPRPYQQIAEALPFAQDYYPHNPPGGKKVFTLTNQKEY